MTDAEIRRFVHHFVGCWERRDLAIVDCYEDDCTVEGPIFGTIRGRAHVREMFQQLFR